MLSSSSYEGSTIFTGKSELLLFSIWAVNKKLSTSSDPTLHYQIYYCLLRLTAFHLWTYIYVHQQLGGAVVSTMGWELCPRSWLVSRWKADVLRFPAVPTFAIISWDADTPWFVKVRASKSDLPKNLWKYINSLVQLVVTRLWIPNGLEFESLVQRTACCMWYVPTRTRASELPAVHTCGI